MSVKPQNRMDEANLSLEYGLSLLFGDIFVRKISSLQQLLSFSMYKWQNEQHTHSVRSCPGSIAFIRSLGP